jgi:hypothetical protein
MARSIDTQQSAVRGFVPAQNDEERFLMRHVEDLARAAFGRGIARYSAFLSDREQQLAQAALNRAGARAAGPTPSAGCSASSRKTATLQALSAASGSGAVRWPGRSCPSIRTIWAA